MPHQDPPATQRDKHGHDPEPIISARQAAEALFTPKRPLAERSDREIPPTVDQPLRKPRVLTIASPAPVRTEKHKAPVSTKQRKGREIPKSHFPRIRTWMMYGMTARDVAEVCEVSVEEIGRILRKV